MQKNTELERLADALAAHEDYVVLRRMPADGAHAAIDPETAYLKVAIIDVETTGLLPEKDKIIELGTVILAVDPESLHSLGVVDSYQGFEDPGFPIPPETTAVHGINDAMVKGQRLDDTHLADIFDGVHLVIAHNAGFDRRFVEQRLPFFQTLPWGCSQIQIDWRSEGIGSAKLEYLAYKYGFFYDAHRAKTDCLALARVLTDLLPTKAITGLSALIEAAKHPSIRIWAINSPFDSKDVLKAHGYSWEPGRKCWHFTTTMAALKDEARWLRDNAYGGRDVLLEFESLDATVLFSGRRGNVSRKQVPARKAA